MKTFELSNKDILMMRKGIEQMLTVPNRFSVKLKMSKIGRVLQEITELIESEKTRLIELYAQRDEQGEIKYGDDRQAIVDPRYWRALSLLMNCKSEVTIPIIKASDLLGLDDTDESYGQSLLMVGYALEDDLSKWD